MEKIHLTILLTGEDDIHEVEEFLYIGVKRLSFTFCHASSPLLQTFDLYDKMELLDLTIDSEPLGLTMNDKQDDPLQDALDKLEATPLPPAKQRFIDTELPVVEEVYFDGFEAPSDGTDNPDSFLVFQDLLQMLDLSGLTSLELRRCRYADQLLQVLSQEVELPRLRTIRVVDIPWSHAETLHGTSWHAPDYRPFFRKFSCLEGIVLDDRSFGDLFILDLIPNSWDTLEKLELHVIHDCRHFAGKDPTESEIKAEDDIDATALAEVGYHCPNIKELHIDLLREEFEDQVGLIAASNLKVPFSDLSYRELLQRRSVA